MHFFKRQSHKMVKYTLKCLSVYDHFVKLALKRLRTRLRPRLVSQISQITNLLNEFKRKLMFLWLVF